MLVGRGRVAGARAIENARGFGLRGKIGENTFHAMIGKPRAQGVEIIVARFECAEKVGERGDMDVAGRGKQIDPGVERPGRVHVQGFIGTKRGIDAEGAL